MFFVVYSPAPGRLGWTFWKGHDFFEWKPGDFYLRGIEKLAESWEVVTKQIYIINIY